MYVYFVTFGHNVRIRIYNQLNLIIMKTVFAITEQCVNAFKKYSQSRDVKDLAFRLNEANRYCQKEFGGNKKSIWFKFGNDDTMATTVNDIVGGLSLPPYHNNYRFIISKIKNVCRKNVNLLVFYS